MINDYFMQHKTDLQKAKDKVTDDITNQYFHQSGMIDMYYMGQLNILESIFTRTDKYLAKGLLDLLDSYNNLDISDNIKNVAKELYKKLQKEYEDKYYE